MGGAVVAAVKAPAVHKLAAIPAGESVAWAASYRVTSFDRITLQAFILLPAKCSVQPGACATPPHSLALPAHGRVCLL